MEPNQEGEQGGAGTDPLLDEQEGKGYGAGRPEEEGAAEEREPADDEDE